MTEGGSLSSHGFVSRPVTLRCSLLTAALHYLSGTAGGQRKRGEARVSMRQNIAVRFRFRCFGRQ